MEQRHLVAASLFLSALAAAQPVRAVAATSSRDTSPPVQLYTLTSEATLPASARVDAPDAVEEFTIEVDPLVVVRNPPAFNVDLPTLGVLEAERTRFVVYRPDWMSWTGNLHRPGDKLARGTIHIGYHARHGRQLTALIEFEGWRFRIVGGFGEAHRLVRLAEELSVPSCGLEMTSRDGGALDLEDFAAPRSEAGGTPEAVTATRVDVLAVYPRAFFGYGPTTEVSMFNFIQDSISLANNALTNSQINATYNLVSIVPITGTQPASTGLFDALIWLNTQPSEVANLRNAFGADVVTIYLPYIWDSNPYCGVANLPQNNGTFGSATSSTTTGTVNQPMGDRAFTSNRASCGLYDYTLGHEIGHNYGMRHETEGTTGVVLFPNGRGNDLTSLGKSTVMACTCSSNCGASSSAVCNRVPYFSDPNISYMGVATGTSTRNNAAVGRTQTAAYAGFRAQSSNTPPTANFTVSCVGRTCSFNASTSTDNTTIPTSGYWWDFGDGTTGSGKLVNHTYSYGTFFWVHLVVKDSGGQTDVTLNSATPQ